MCRWTHGGVYTQTQHGSRIVSGGSSQIDGSRYTRASPPSMEFDAPRVSVREDAERPPDVPKKDWSITPAAKAIAETRQSMMDRTCAELLWIEAAHVLQASTAFKVRQANDIVKQLEIQDSGAHIPPPLSASDEADMASGRMEAIGRHVGGNLTEQYVVDLHARH